MMSNIQEGIFSIGGKRAKCKNTESDEKEEVEKEN